MTTHHQVSRERRYWAFITEVWFARVMRRSPQLRHIPGTRARQGGVQCEGDVAALPLDTGVLAVEQLVCATAYISQTLKHTTGHLSTQAQTASREWYHRQVRYHWQTTANQILKEIQTFLGSTEPCDLMRRIVLMSMEGKSRN